MTDHEQELPPPAESKAPSPKGMRWLLLLLLLTWGGLFIAGKMILEEFRHTQHSIAQIPHKEPTDNNALTAHIEGIEARVTALETTPPITPDMLISDAQESILPDRHIQPTTSSDVHSAMILSTVQLQDRIRQALPYDNILYMITSLAQDPIIQDYLTIIKPYANQGVANIAQLNTEFTALIPAILALAHQPSEDASWSDKMLGQLREVVTIRYLGEDEEGPATDRILHQVEQVLQAGNILEALTLLATLEDPLQPPIATWITKAEAHMVTNEAIFELYNHLTNTPLTTLSLPADE
jgi:hypothetical protein